ncbi:MAG: undecaprenyl-diphosphate phosphatase [Clostridiaceae bacterium]|nr:undecaprenyl-diphosphate phosphatase [Clostridiaceae bacterium]NBI83812.1 undecaprenyl-diphosphate phosphatase [Clostridiaceae bacterium]
MTAKLAVLLGIVQGLTEFLPVSSSGHLVLVQTFFGGSNPEADYMLFDVLLHFGTLVSVFIAFWGDIRELIIEFFGWVGSGFKLEGHAYRRFIVMVLITIVPMFPVLLIKDQLDALFSNTMFVGCALLVTAFVLLLSERAPRLHKDAANASWLDALLVGCAQAVAVVPGISRSGSTICAGLFRGFSRDFAVRFAFIMSLPVVFGANLLEVGDALAQAESTGIPLHLYAIGIFASMVSGLLAIRLIRLVTNKGHFRPFVIYCGLVGVLSIVATLAQSLAAGA